MPTSTRYYWLPLVVLVLCLILVYALRENAVILAAPIAFIALVGNLLTPKKRVSGGGQHTWEMTQETVESETRELYEDLKDASSMLAMLEGSQNYDDIDAHIKDAARLAGKALPSNFLRRKVVIDVSRRMAEPSMLESLRTHLKKYRPSSFFMDLDVLDGEVKPSGLLMVNNIANSSNVHKVLEQINNLMQITSLPNDFISYLRILYSVLPGGAAKYSDPLEPQEIQTIIDDFSSKYTPDKIKNELDIFLAVLESKEVDPPRNARKGGVIKPAPSRPTRQPPSESKSAPSRPASKPTSESKSAPSIPVRQPTSESKSAPSIPARQPLSESKSDDIQPVAESKTDIARYNYGEFVKPGDGSNADDLDRTFFAHNHEIPQQAPKFTIRIPKKKLSRERDSVLDINRTIWKEYNNINAQFSPPLDQYQLIIQPRKTDIEVFNLSSILASQVVLALPDNTVDPLSALWFLFIRYKSRNNILTVDSIPWKDYVEPATPDIQSTTTATPLTSFSDVYIEPVGSPVETTRLPEIIHKFSPTKTDRVYQGINKSFYEHEMNRKEYYSFANTAILYYLNIIKKSRTRLSELNELNGCWSVINKIRAEINDMGGIISEQKHLMVSAELRKELEEQSRLLDKEIALYRDREKVAKLSLSELQEVVHNMAMELRKKQNDLARLESDADSIKQERVLFENEKQMLFDSHIAIVREKEALTAEIEALKLDISKKTLEIQTLNKEIQSLDQKLQDSEMENQSLNRMISELRNKITTMQYEYDRTLEVSGRLNESNLRLNDLNKDYLKEIVELRQEKLVKTREHEDAISELSEKLTECERSGDNLKSELELAETKVSESEAALQDVTTQLEVAQKNLRGYRGKQAEVAERYNAAIGRQVLNISNARSILENPPSADLGTVDHISSKSNQFIVSKLHNSIKLGVSMLELESHINYLESQLMSKQRVSERPLDVNSIANELISMSYEKSSEILRAWETNNKINTLRERDQQIIQTLREKQLDLKSKLDAANDAKEAYTVNAPVKETILLSTIDSLTEKVAVAKRELSERKAKVSILNQKLEAALQSADSILKTRSEISSKMRALLDDIDSKMAKERLAATIKAAELIEDVAKNAGYRGKQVGDSRLEEVAGWLTTKLAEHKKTANELIDQKYNLEEEVYSLKEYIKRSVLFTDYRSESIKRLQEDVEYAHSIVKDILKGQTPTKILQTREELKRAENTSTYLENQLADSRTIIDKQQQRLEELTKKVNPSNFDMISKAHGIIASLPNEPDRETLDITAREIRQVLVSNEMLSKYVPMLQSVRDKVIPLVMDSDVSNGVENIAQSLSDYYRTKDDWLVVLGVSTMCNLNTLTSGESMSRMIAEAYMYSVGDVSKNLQGLVEEPIPQVLKLLAETADMCVKMKIFAISGSSENEQVFSKIKLDDVVALHATASAGMHIESIAKCVAGRDNLVDKIQALKQQHREEKSKLREIHSRSADIQLPEIKESIDAIVKRLQSQQQDATQINNDMETLRKTHSRLLNSLKDVDVNKMKEELSTIKLERDKLLEKISRSVEPAYIVDRVKAISSKHDEVAKILESMKVPDRAIVDAVRNILDRDVNSIVTTLEDFAETPDFAEAPETSNNIDVLANDALKASAIAEKLDYITGIMTGRTMNVSKRIANALDTITNIRAINVTKIRNKIDSLESEIKKTKNPTVKETIESMEKSKNNIEKYPNVTKDARFDPYVNALAESFKIASDSYNDVSSALEQHKKFIQKTIEAKIKEASDITATHSDQEASKKIRELQNKTSYQEIEIDRLKTGLEQMQQNLSKKKTDIDEMSSIVREVGEINDNIKTKTMYILDREFSKTSTQLEELQKIKTELADKKQGVRHLAGIALNKISWEIFMSRILQERKDKLVDMIGKVPVELEKAISKHKLYLERMKNYSSTGDQSMKDYNNLSEKIKSSEAKCMRDLRLIADILDIPKDEPKLEEAIARNISQLVDTKSRLVDAARFNIKELTNEMKVVEDRYQELVKAYGAIQASKSDDLSLMTSMSNKLKEVQTVKNRLQSDLQKSTDLLKALNNKEDNQVPENSLVNEGYKSSKDVIRREHSDLIADNMSNESLYKSRLHSVLAESDTIASSMADKINKLMIEHNVTQTLIGSTLYPAILAAKGELMRSIEEANGQIRDNEIRKAKLLEIQDKLSNIRNQSIDLESLRKAIDSIEPNAPELDTLLAKVSDNIDKLPDVVRMREALSKLENRLSEAGDGANLRVKSLIAKMDVNMAKSISISESLANILSASIISLDDDTTAEEVAAVVDSIKSTLEKDISEDQKAALIDLYAKVSTLRGFDILQKVRNLKSMVLDETIPSLKKANEDLSETLTISTSELNEVLELVESKISKINAMNAIALSNVADASRKLELVKTRSAIEKQQQFTDMVSEVTKVIERLKRSSEALQGNSSAVIDTIRNRISSLRESMQRDSVFIESMKTANQKRAELLQSRIESLTSERDALKLEVANASSAYQTMLTGLSSMKAYSVEDIKTFERIRGNLTNIISNSILIRSDFDKTLASIRSHIVESRRLWGIKSAEVRDSLNLLQAMREGIASMKNPPNVDHILDTIRLAKSTSIDYINELKSQLATVCPRDPIVDTVPPEYESLKKAYVEELQKNNILNDAISNISARIKDMSVEDIKKSISMLKKTQRTCSQRPRIVYVDDPVETVVYVEVEKNKPVKPKSVKPKPTKFDKYVKYLKS